MNILTQRKLWRSETQPLTQYVLREAADGRCRMVLNWKRCLLVPFGEVAAENYLAATYC